MTRLEFLQSTINHYNSKNRAVNENGSCCYTPTATSDGCAIGRWLDKKTLDSICNTVIVRDIEEKLPVWMFNLGLDFLTEIQTLHDMDDFWNPLGLSPEGKEFVKSLYIKFDL